MALAMSAGVARPRYSQDSAVGLTTPGVDSRLRPGEAQRRQDKVEGTTPDVPGDPIAELARRLELPDPEYQELWFALSRHNWSSVVLVPADEGESTASLATALADVGRRLRYTPVTAMVADQLDFAAAAQMAPRVATPNHNTARPKALAAPTGQVIVAIPPVVVEPLGVAVARAADAVVLCVEVGHSRVSSTRRTIDLIGREQIAGCFLIRK